METNLARFSGEIAEIKKLIGKEGKEGKDKSSKVRELMVKIVSEINNGSLSSKVLMDFNNIVSKDFVMERTYLNYLPQKFLCDNQIFTNTLRNINSSQDMSIEDTVDLFAILAKKNIVGYLHKDQKEKITYEYYRKYSTMMYSTLENFKEKCTDQRSIETLEDIEKEFDKRENYVEENYGKNKEKQSEEYINKSIN